MHEYVVAKKTANKYIAHQLMEPYVYVADVQTVGLTMLHNYKKKPSEKPGTPGVPIKKTKMGHYTWNL